MLARPETRKCIECGLQYGTPDFAYHYGRIGNGPAYWTDRGILCSITCSAAHFERRKAEGTLPSAPPRDPFDWHGR